MTSTDDPALATPPERVEGPTVSASPWAGLRPLTPEDLAGFAFLHLDAAGSAPGVPAGQLWLTALGGLNARLGGGWAIVGGGEARAIGLVVYHAVDARQETAMLSYALDLDARGHGLGTAAVGEAVRRLLGEIGFKTLFADVELVNVASRRLLHKVGFDALTAGVTPGVQVGPARPAQRWRMGQARYTAGRSIINLGAVGPF